MYKRQCRVTVVEVVVVVVVVELKQTNGQRTAAVTADVPAIITGVDRNAACPPAGGPGGRGLAVRAGGGTGASAAAPLPTG